MTFDFQNEEWPAHHAVAKMHGSLPMGGVAPTTSIHAFTIVAAALVFQEHAELLPARRNIEIAGQLASEISDVVTSYEADAIIAASEHFGCRDEAPGISTPPFMRMNKSVHWVADNAMMGPIFARIAHLLPITIDNAVLSPRLSHRLNMYRYDANDVFNGHTDGDWPGFGLSDNRSQMMEWPSLRSCLTMILYLNGETGQIHLSLSRLWWKMGWCMCPIGQVAVSIGMEPL